MTFIVDGYTVTINARKPGKKRKEATIELLNAIACMAWSARSHNEEKGYNVLAKGNRDYAVAFGDAWRALEGGNA